MICFGGICCCEALKAEGSVFKQERLHCSSHLRLKADGSVVAWGNSPWYDGDCSEVQHQLVDVQHIYSTNHAFAALKADGSVVAWGHEWFGGDCSKVQDQLVDVRSIYSTETAFAALKADGAVVAWGENHSEAD